MHKWGYRNDLEPQSSRIQNLDEIDLLQVSKDINFSKVVHFALIELM